MKKSKRLIFFGTEDFSASFLEALINAGYDIVAVITKTDSRRGRGQKLTSPEVKNIALKHNIPVWQPKKLKEIVLNIKSVQPITGVLVSFGKIIPPLILDLFEPGIINVHPSLLPKYRGPAPIEGALLGGDTKTGVTIMKLTAGMDEGPVYAQSFCPILPTETKASLYQKLSDVGVNLLLKTLPKILDGSLQPKAQSNHDATYTTLISKKDGILDPLTDNAYALERKVRAYQGFPKPKLNLKNNQVILTSVQVVSKDDSHHLVVKCTGNTFLKINSLVAPNGKSMSGDAFKHGYLRS